MAQLMPLPLTVSCSSKIQIGFTFRVPAYPGCPKKEAVKWLYNVLLFCWQVISGVIGSAVGAILRWIETLSHLSSSPTESLGGVFSCVMVSVCLRCERNTGAVDIKVGCF